MSQIKIKKGLDIPIEGRPYSHTHAREKVEHLYANGRTIAPTHLALNLVPFEEVKFRLLCKVGETVKVGQPLAEDKSAPGRFFVSPAGGIVRDVSRGTKRTLQNIIIDLLPKEETLIFPPLDPVKASRNELIERLMTGGLFTHIRQRPFDFLADPSKTPRCIFVNAVESAPFHVPPELQVKGYEREFQLGLDALTRLTSGPVHLVYHSGTQCNAFIQALGVQTHTAEGPHPIGTPSVHIAAISPIEKVNDVIWTLAVQDVIGIGNLLMHGTYYTRRVIAIGGPGIVDGHIGFYEVRHGMPIAALLAGRVSPGAQRLISGDVLTGRKVDNGDFLGFYDTAFCVIPENTDREFLHFFRLGLDKYTASRAYFSGHLHDPRKDFAFTTSLHGEPRAFITGDPYDKVMPLPVPTVEFCKALMAEDYDLAAELGILDVVPEDFALTTFVDPSKIEMMEIVRDGQKEYAREMLGK